jgi:malonyl-CoA O-methyltransferase
MHNAKQEFSRFANSYQELNIIQREVAKELLGRFDFKPSTILDLGSGTGEICKNINFEFKRFVAVDISLDMCNLHPKSDKITVINSDFEDSSIFESRYDLIISSSALQWSKNLDYLFEKISSATNKIAFAIFTSNTFVNLNLSLKLESLIYDSKTLIEILKRYFDIEFEIKNYTLEFTSTLELLRYIKKSGVSGGTKRLEHKNIKTLIDKNELHTLEFEVLYVVGTLKKL